MRGCRDGDSYERYWKFLPSLHSWMRCCCCCYLACNVFVLRVYALHMRMIYYPLVRRRTNLKRAQVSIECREYDEQRIITKISVGGEEEDGMRLKILNFIMQILLLLLLLISTCKCRSYTHSQYRSDRERKNCPKTFRRLAIFTYNLVHDTYKRTRERWWGDWAS